jgi:hypothetical protein
MILQSTQQHAYDHHRMGVPICCGDTVSLWQCAQQLCTSQAELPVGEGLQNFVPTVVTVCCCLLLLLATPPPCYGNNHLHPGVIVCVNSAGEHAAQGGTDGRHSMDKMLPEQQAPQAV